MFTIRLPHWALSWSSRASGRKFCDLPARISWTSVGVSMITEKSLRVGILFGGRSGEHEVSLASAASVIRALDPEKYEAVPIGIGKDGRWFIGTPAQKMLPDVLRHGHRIMLSADPSVGALLPMEERAAG